MTDRPEAAIAREQARVDRIVAAARESDPSTVPKDGRSLTAEEIAAQYPATRPLPEGYRRSFGRPTADGPVIPPRELRPGEYHKMSAAEKRAYAASRRELRATQVSAPTAKDHLEPLK